MYSTHARNTMLDAIGVTHASLHTAYSAVGANEVAGGAPAYARKAATFNAAAGGAKTSSNAPIFDVPAAATIRFIGFWDAVAAGNFKGMVANGASSGTGIGEFEFWIDVVANTVEHAAHGLLDGDKIVFYNGAAPGGLVEGTVYFVVNKTVDDFQVAATLAGAAIDLVSQAADSVVCAKIVEETFGAQGTHTVTSSSLGLNN
jgi:hypothetical protein